MPLISLKSCMAALPKESPEFNLNANTEESVKIQGRRTSLLEKKKWGDREEEKETEAKVTRD